MQRRGRLHCITDFDNDYCINDTVVPCWTNTHKLIDILSLSDEKAMFVSNDVGKIKYVNSKWCELCECSSESIIGKSFNVMHGPKTDILRTRDFIKTLNNSGTANMVIVNYSPKGNELHLYVEAYKISPDICYGYAEETYISDS